jgi:glycogen debranching enzyme
MSIDTSPHKGSNPIVIDGISYIPSSALLTGIPKISFKDNRAFAVVDPQGESPRLYSSGSELGFYFNDTRYLGIWEMTFNGIAGVALAKELRFGGNTVVFSMTNRDFQKIGESGRIPRDTFLIRRVLTFYEDCLFETVEIKNFDSVTHELQVEQWAGGRFDDVFEVRGFPRAKRGRMLPTEEKEDQGNRISILQYEGLDGRIRKTYIHRLFNAEKIRISPSLVGYYTRVKVPAKETVLLKTVVSFDQGSECKLKGVNYSEVTVAEKMKLLYHSSLLSPFTPLHFSSDNAIVNRSISNAQTDIYMLLTQEAGNNLYPYAGIPWFSAPFGRDGIITAYQLLPWYPSVARGVLEYVFQTLGSRVDPFTDEQPGKVFHEVRRGEMASTREVPFIPYYGSVDSTPLALILLHEYIRWTLDKKQLLEWWPSALRALEWIEKWGDTDGDGFLEYAKQSPNGLINQGWKDSHDSVMHSDGRLAPAPIRLCEVQGYSYRARMSMSVLAKFLGDEQLSARLRRQALELKAKFTEKYWDSEGQFIYLAIDGEYKPCAVRSSNMGHCLWSQIVTAEQARAVSNLLISEEMFSGHGIRTLASREASYNPLSYHNGSIWPHDNSLIMEGMRMFGHTSELDKVSHALIEVLESSEDFRLPELYCGFRKRGVEPPVPYEVACKPQAWAAGSIFLMFKSMLGISTEVDQSYLVFNSPLLTSKINTFEVKNLQGRDWELDFVVRRAKYGTTVEVLRKKGDIRVLTVK